MAAATEKHDVFVGNLTFNTTEEQLYDIFSFVGPVKNVRILQDKETMRPKGFAFIEYNDVNIALAAIRRLDGTQLNGRSLRVSYSNNSNLREVAKSIGQDVIESEPTLRQETQVILNLQLYEAWDILDYIKKIADDDNGQKIRALLETYPQLIPAIIQIQKRLGMVSSNVSTNVSNTISRGRDDNTTVLESNEMYAMDVATHQSSNLNSNTQQDPPVFNRPPAQVLIYLYLYQHTY